MPFNVGPAELILLLLIAAMIALPVLLVVVLARAAGRSSQPASPDPRAVLAVRLARGEISRAEFDTAMRALGLSD
jgi:uncharacterized membrane protein